MRCPIATRSGSAGQYLAPASFPARRALCILGPKQKGSAIRNGGAQGVVPRAVRTFALGVMRFIEAASCQSVKRQRRAPPHPFVGVLLFRRQLCCGRLGLASLFFRSCSLRRWIKSTHFFGNASCAILPSQT